MNEKEGRTEEEEIKTKNSNGTASKHVMVKSRFFFKFFLFWRSVSLPCPRLVTGRYSCNETLPKFIHFTRPTVFSLSSPCTSIYVSVRFLAYSFVVFFIAFSVVVCCCCFCWRPRGNSDEREIYCPEMAARDGVCFRPLSAPASHPYYYFFKLVLIFLSCKERQDT